MSSIFESLGAQWISAERAKNRSIQVLYCQPPTGNCQLGFSRVGWAPLTMIDKSPPPFSSNVGLNICNLISKLYFVVSPAFVLSKFMMSSENQRPDERNIFMASDTDEIMPRLLAMISMPPLPKYEIPIPPEKSRNPTGSSNSSEIELNVNFSHTNFIIINNDQASVPSGWG